MAPAPVAHCLLPIAYCLLPIVYYLLPITYCPCQAHAMGTGPGPWAPNGLEPSVPLPFPPGPSAAMGHILGFCQKWTSLSEQMGSKYCACAQNQASRTSVTAVAAVTSLTEVVSTAVAQNLPSDAPGPRMTRVHQLLKIIYIYIYIYIYTLSWLCSAEASTIGNRQ